MKSLLLAPALALFLAPVHAQGLPDGPGKAVYENVCGACHGADIVLGQTGTRDVWQDTVDSMQAKGALASSNDDFKTIVSYLVRNFGVAVNVNTAPAKEIADNLDLTSAEAEAIVKARTDKGKFKDYADLSQVQGVDFKKLDPIKNRVKF